MSGAGEPLIELGFEAQVIHWRGPSPFFFVAVPARHVEALRLAAKSVSYGWGMVPVEAAIGAAIFRTALFPKDETYLLPLKAAVRRQADVTAGDTVAVDVTVRSPA